MTSTALVKQLWHFVFSSALWYCPAELLWSFGRLSPVAVRKHVFSETVKHILRKFCRKLSVHYISKPFFFQNLLYFYDFVFFFINMGPYGSEVWNDTSSESTHQIRSQQIMHTPNQWGSLPKLFKELWFFLFLPFQTVISEKPVDLWLMLLLTATRKSYIRSSSALSDLTLSDTERWSSRLGI